MGGAERRSNKMKKKIIGIFLVMLLIGITVLPATGDINKKINQDINNTSLQSIPGISFYQVDYQWTKTTYVNSNTGQIVVNIDELNAATGLEYGYVNVYTSKGWVIQNLEIIGGSAAIFPYSSVGTYFDLGQSGDVKSIGAYVDYSAEPYLSFAYSAALPPYPVYDTILNAEGGEGFIILIRPQPPLLHHLPGSGGNYNPLGINTNCVQKEHPNIQTAHMQCVPAAYANNLQYLEDWYGTYIPHDNIPGLGGSPSNSLVGRLDLYMGRSFESRLKGNATGYNDSIKGLLEYAYFESLQIDMRHQGRKGDTNIEYEDSGYISYGQGLTVKFSFINEEICRGSGVELAMGYFNTYGERKGGHMVQIVAAGYVYDVPYIYFLDDRVQINENCIECDSWGTSGPPLRRWLIDTDNDGLYNLVEDPESYGSPPEVECIYVQQARNSPPLKPSMPAGGALIMEKNVEYEFFSKTTDPNGHPIWYWFDWGDGTNSNWVGQYDSGENGYASHSWEQEDIYEIKVKAKDFNGAESEWSDSRYGVVPKPLIYDNKPFLNFLENHTHLFPFLRQLLNLQ